MFQKNNGWAGRFVVYLISISSLLFLFVLVRYGLLSSKTAFTLHFNRYAVISFGSGIFDLVIIFVIIIKKRFLFTTNWFLLFLIGATVMAITEGLERSSAFPSGALFWQNLYYIGLSLLPWSFYLFIVSFTSHYRRQFIFLTSLLILTWGFIAFYSGAGLVFNQNVAHIISTPWGYNGAQTPVEQYSVMWFSFIYVLGNGLLLQFWKDTKDRLVRRQIKIIFFAFLIPFVVAIVTSQIIPTINPRLIPPLATLFGSGSGILLYFGIFRYHLFEIDAQALAQNILDTMSDAVIITRPDLSIESINHEAERLLGIKNDEADNLNLEDLFSDRAWSFILTKTNSRKPSNDPDINDSNHFLKSSNGELIPVRISISEIKSSNEKIANILVLTNIKELTRSFDALQNSASKIYQQNENLRQLENQLRQEKANVENIVEVRTKALVEAQNKLKASDELKTEFVMLTSHNLRTPLAVAKGYAEMINNQSQISPENKPFFDGLRNGLDRLGKLVEDLLTISSIESGYQPNLDEVPFQQIIEPLIAEANDLARARKDNFVVNLHSGELKVKANPERLQGAVRNVLDNAFKFTEGGTVELNTIRSDNKLIINITDTGIGLDPTELPKLFTKFHRAANALNGNYEGKGIGLYLTKLIIDEHGGKISVVSQPNQGATFTIELPCF